MTTDDRPPGRREDELLRALVENVPAMLACWDSTLRCRFANRAYQHWFGVSPDVLVGKHVSELLGPLYRLNLPYMERALRGQPQEFEREIPDPWGGSSRYGVIRYVPDLVGGVVQGFFVLVTDISEIKRAISERKRLEDDRRVFVALLDNSPDFIAISDPAGVPRYINPAGRRMVGLPAEHPVGTTRIPDYYAPEQRDAATEGIFRAMLELGRWTGETAFRHWRTEESVPVSQEHFTIRDPDDGRVLGMGAVARDISEARRTSREREQLLAREQRARELAEATSEMLRDSEERFRLIIDEAPIGMALVSLDGRLVRVNRVLCEIVGYTADELTALTFQAITHPEDLDADLALVDQLARGEIPRYQLRKRYVRKDGAIIDASLSVSVLRSPDGAPRYYIGQVEDITERKRLEDEQRRVEGEQRFLAEVGPVLAGSLAYEETLAQVADLAVRELADLCIVDVIEEGDEVRSLTVAARDPSKAWVCDALRRVELDRSRPYLLRSVLEARRPLLLVRPSAETIASFAQNTEHLRALRGAEIQGVVAVPLVAHEKLLGGVAIVSSTPARIYGPRDIGLVEELARRAALSIENARLYRAAQRATQARDEVLGIVAHDLRNPLNGVMMQAGDLRRRKADPTRRSQRAGELIERAAHRMNRLIDDLLDVTRMEAGRLSVEPASTAAEQILADSVEAQSPLVASASLKLGMDVQGPLPEIWADRDRLLQVFENLIGNALKFTPPGGRISVGAALSGAEVVFRVTDTGSGIAAEDLPHLFDRFWQGRKARGRWGTGLGLPIVKGVVEAHRGRIWVESAPGSGSTFFFTIPVVRRAERRPPPAHPRGP
jgi:PAS domain S-box-containing protein